MILEVQPHLLWLVGINPTIFQDAHTAEDARIDTCLHSVCIAKVNKTCKHDTSPGPPQKYLSNRLYSPAATSKQILNEPVGTQ